MCFFRNLLLKCFLITIAYFCSETSYGVVPYFCSGGYFHLFLYSFFCEKNTDLNSFSEEDKECSSCQDKNLDDSDMILHLQLKINDASLMQQMEARLDRKNTFCLLNPDDLGLLHEKKGNQKIAVSSLQCPECWEKFNKDNPRESKSLLDDSAIQLPRDFKEFQLELKNINEKIISEAMIQAEQKETVQSKATKNKNVEERGKAKVEHQTKQSSLLQGLQSYAQSFFRNPFKKSSEKVVVDSSANKDGGALGATSLELDNQDTDGIFDLFFNPEEEVVLKQLQEFCHYKTLKNRFLDVENTLSAGHFSPDGYEDSTKMVYIAVEEAEGGYFVFDSKEHKSLYKVIIQKDEKWEAFKVDRGRNQRQWNNFVSIAKDQIIERKKLKPKPEKPEYFNLSELLSILTALDG
jgi:DNA-binding HxlR family transcriptional regulator